MSPARKGEIFKHGDWQIYKNEPYFYLIYSKEPYYEIQCKYTDEEKEMESLNQPIPLVLANEVDEILSKYCNF